MTFGRFLDIANHILDGDESQSTASELETVIINQHPDDKRFSELAEALALYAPGNGKQYYDPGELRKIIRSVIQQYGETTENLI
jgi:hypothetical protein